MYVAHEGAQLCGSVSFILHIIHMETKINYVIKYKMDVIDIIIIITYGN